jgi:thiol-disulfide isomerase/thioredoxin
MVLVALSAQASAADRYDFELEEITTGEMLDRALLTDGRPLIFHVWSTNCPHCKRHMPYAVALFKKIDPDEVNFVSCCVNSSRREALDYVDEKEIAFAVLLEGTGRLGYAYTDEGWPTTFVLAPGGEFVGWCDTQGPSYISETLELVELARSW